MNAKRDGVGRGPGPLGVGRSVPVGVDDLGVGVGFEGGVEEVGEPVDVSCGGDVSVEHGEGGAVVAVGVAVGDECRGGDAEGPVGGLVDLDGVAELEGVVDGLGEVLSGVGGDLPEVHGVPVRGWVL